MPLNPLIACRYVLQTRRYSIVVLRATVNQVAPGALPRSGAISCSLHYSRSKMTEFGNDPLIPLIWVLYFSKRGFVVHLALTSRHGENTLH